MRTLFLKKVKTGYMTDINKTSNTNNIYPMALHVYDKFKHKLTFPCYIQPKLDGIRCTITYNLNTNKITILSRRLHKLHGFDFMRDDVKTLLGYDDELILDGELYNHKMNLQQISGIVRNEDKNNKNKQNLQFHIFDCIDLKHRLTFQDRITLLNTKFNESHNLKYLFLTPTTVIHNVEQGDTLFKEYLKNKYEGIVYKNMNALYDWSNIKEKRSYGFLKRKNVLENEYKAVGYTQGKGSNVGAIVLIMETETGLKFNVVPNATLVERKEMFKLAKNDFNKHFENKMFTIRFDDYSKDGVPLRAKLITIRPDYL